MTNIADAANTQSMSYKFRAKRDEGLRAFLLQARSGVSGTARIVDLGGGRAYWERVGIDWLSKNDFSVTCINYQEGELTRDSDAGCAGGAAVPPAAAGALHARAKLRASGVVLIRLLACALTQLVCPIGG